VTSNIVKDFFFVIALLDEGVVRDIVYVVVPYMGFLRNEKVNKMQFIIGGITKFHETRMACCTFFSVSFYASYNIRFD
jgi:hypothetical protein